MTRYCQQIEWLDCPHLSEQQIAEQIASTPPYQLDARSKGIPILGKGKVYALDENDYITTPFEIPSYWPQAYGMDADWNRTAVVWGAWDKQSDIVYGWSEHFGGQMPPAVHADAIRSRGAWMVGAMDPSTHGKISPLDGKRLSEAYLDLGLDLVNADNAVEAGIFSVYQRMSAGRLKIFSTCTKLRSQLLIYRRGDDGRVIKEQDDLPDALRYLIMTGMFHASVEPLDPEEFNAEVARHERDRITGY